MIFMKDFAYRRGKGRNLNARCINALSRKFITIALPCFAKICKLCRGECEARGNVLFMFEEEEG